jgi:hypothetical protein
MSVGEILLVGDADRAEALDRWPVLATVAPDVVVLRAEAKDLPAIARHARLAMARLPDGGTRTLGDERALDGLDDGARLFVRAWRARPLEKPERVGEGASWDASGFEPPGPPTS